MRLVLMGPPGAGKGTQAKRMAERLNMVHLSSGDIFRAEKAGGSQLGQTLEKYMAAGELVPDDIVVKVMAGAIAAVDAAKGLLLDGFPRTGKQAEALDEQLAALGRPIDAALVIDVADDLLVDRITGRRSCPACGEAYHLQYLAPAEEGKCDKCGAELVQRPDDTEEVVRERLTAYHGQTAPVIGYYESGARPVIRVDGDAPPDVVTERIAEALTGCGQRS